MSSSASEYNCSSSFRNSEKALGNSASGDIHHLHCFPHFSPLVSAHAHDEVHCRCRVRRDVLLFPPPQIPTRVACPPYAFLWGQGSGGESWRGSKSQWRGIWQQSSQHLQPPLHANFAASFGDNLCVQQTKTSLGYTVRLTESRQCVQNWELGEIEDLKLKRITRSSGVTQSAHWSKWAVEISRRQSMGEDYFILQ